MIRYDCKKAVSFLLFPERCAIARACTGIHASNFMCAIYCMCKVIVFSFLFSFFFWFNEQLELGKSTIHTKFQWVKFKIKINFSLITIVPKEPDFLIKLNNMHLIFRFSKKLYSIIVNSWQLCNAGTY